MVKYFNNVIRFAYSNIWNFVFISAFYVLHTVFLSFAKSAPTNIVVRKKIVSVIGWTGTFIAVCQRGVEYEVIEIKEETWKCQSAGKSSFWSTRSGTNGSHRNGNSDSLMLRITKTLPVTLPQPNNSYCRTAILLKYHCFAKYEKMTNTGVWNAKKT